MASTTTKAEPIRCEKCRGEGTVEAVLGHPNDPGAPVREVECERCGGSRAEPCVECGDPATLRSESHRAYCGTECAWNADDWPACTECEGDPQDPTHAPFCGAGCAGAFKNRARRAMRRPVSLSEFFRASDREKARRAAGDDGPCCRDGLCAMCRAAAQEDAADAAREAM
jgi:hypothetical protein